MNASNHPGLRYAKGRTRTQLKARKDRAEATVKRSVRAVCVERDGHCRLGNWERNPDDWHSEALELWRWMGCDGPSEWAHLHARRRSQTRNLEPEIRHSSVYSVCLCRRHHAAYDRHELRITALTRKGADGPLKFRRGKS